MNQLRATFGATDCSECHEESQFEINIAQRAMLFRRYDRLANDVRQVRSNRVIPVHSHQAQRGAGYETPAHAKEPTQNSNDKADNDQINRVDVRVGDWKKHELSRAAAQEAKQKRRHTIQENGLPNDEQKGYPGIDVAILRYEVITPLAQDMKNQ